MKKICFGKNITTVNKKMSNLTDNIKSSLREVYRFPKNLEDVSNCFNGCVNLTKFEAELPNTIKNMSSSFEGCGNFYKNVAIPSDCIDMSRSFKGAGIKGSINIPDKVVDMRESFKDSKLEAVSFNENISYFNNFQESFLNCKTLAYVYGNLPQSIVNGEGSFKNTGIAEVNFFRENSFINNADKMFEHCKNLVSVGNIKSNSFLHTWNGCSNLKSIGIINGVLNFNNTFNGCHNYSDVVYLHPYFDGTDNSYLSIGDSDRSFLNNQALRIYGVGHGLENELNFQNAHLEKGDYISGYCDPDDFEKTQGDTYSNFFNWSGDTTSLVIPRFFRTNLLDDSTKSSVVFNHAFKNKVFEDVIVYGGDISMHAFNGASMNNLKIYPETKINNYGFHNMSSNTLTIPNHGKTINIGKCCFKDTNIKNAFIYSDINNIEQSAFLSFNGNLFLGNINNISSTTFKSSYGNITSYDKTKNHIINVVGENAFTHMRGIIDIPIKNIGNNAFYNVKNQFLINLADTRHIGENAFYNSGVSSLTIPDSINLINNSLHGMNSLIDLNIYDLNIYQFGGSYPSSLKNVVLRNNTHDVNSTNKLYSVQNITMLNGGDIIDNQFSGLANLKYFKTINSPDVYHNAFSGCTNLLTISNVGTVLRNAFNGCSNLSSLNAKDIVQGALSGCENIQSLTVHNLNATFDGSHIKHIGRLWNVASIINARSVPNAIDGQIIIVTGVSTAGMYNNGVYLYNYNYLSINMSNKLEYVNMYMYQSGKIACRNVFSNIKSLKKIDANFYIRRNEIYNVFDGCYNLTDLNITFSNGSNSFVDSGLVRSINNIININFNFGHGGQTSGGSLQAIVNDLSGYSTLKNVNFGSIGFANGRDKVFFNNCNWGNFSNGITILPDVYAAYNYNSKTNWIHSNFGSNFSVPTQHIGVNSHIRDYYNTNIYDYYNIPSYGMNLNNKIVYFDNHVSFDSGFFSKRTNLTTYVEDIATHALYSDGSSNITLYYTNLNKKPNIYTSTNYITEISNDGKNYYYTNNINVIYEPNYNYSKYVSNIK